MATVTLHATRNDLGVEIRRRMIDLLNQNLADALDLYSQLKQAHWNVKGPHFIQLHELFDKVAGEALAHVDMIAERATALGGVALGTARMAAKHSRLKEYPEEATDGITHAGLVADRLAQYGKQARAAIQLAAEAADADTADLFTEISREADKSLWFVEAHLETSGKAVASGRG